MNETTKTKAINLEDLQLSVQDIYNRGGFGNVGTCNTAAATAAKAVTLGTIFSLSTGCVLLIKFTNGIESENSTLAITHTTLAGTTVTEDAKPIYLNGAALEANIISSGAILILRYNGTQFDIIGGGGQASDAYTKAQTNALLNQKVDKENGKGLSTNDYDAASKTKLDALPTNSELISSFGNKQDTITDMKQLGGGYYTCTTAGSTAAKVVSASGFQLKPNCSFSVLFTNAFIVTQDNPTLNVNSTGAKAIKFFGVSVPVGIIKANTICTFAYDGTDFNITNVEYPKDVLTGNLVDMGLPSGVLWAKKNIDVTQADGFAASEFQYECSFFSWGNIDGYNPISSSAFSYSWDTTSYDASIGSKLTGNIPLSQDAARAACGAQYRMPTKSEYLELYNNCDVIDANGSVIGSSDSKVTTLNGIVGLYLQSKHNGNRIFFPCTGYGYDTAWGLRGSNGFYWSSNIREGQPTWSRCLGFSSSGIQENGTAERRNGLAVRAVM